MTKKGKGTPEAEVIEAIRRIGKKYPESRQSARNSPEWLDFLDNIGISTEGDKRQGFWEKVRQGLKPSEPKRETKRLPVDYERAKVTVDKKGYYHDIATGKFVSRTKVLNVSYFSERRLAEVRVSIDTHGRFRDNETGRYVSKQTIESRY